MSKQKTEKRAISLTKRLINEDYTYAQLRSWNFTGFSHSFLLSTKNAATMSTTAQLTFLMTLAACDLTLGTSIAELIFYCCRDAPIKAFVVSLMTLASTTDMSQLMTSILTYRNHEGLNCLMDAFDMAASYSDTNQKHPDQTDPMMIEIEETIIHLITLGYQHGVDMVTVLNAVSKDGTTLFYRATIYSERVARFLLTKNVKVNSIDDLFQTVTFRFPSLRQELIDAGVNPHALDYDDDTEYDLNSLASLSNIPTVKSIAFAVKPFPCTCANVCAGDLSNEWFYMNDVYPGQFDRVIGQGGEGIVISGYWHGEEAAFKFIPVRKQQLMSYVEDGLANLATRLNEMLAMQSTPGSCILKILGHFRQQLAYNDDPALATKLGMKNGDIKKFEVFVTPLFEGNISEKDNDQFKKRVELDHVKSVITQLLDGLEQLEQAGLCHNDIKPSNILWRVDIFSPRITQHMDGYDVEVNIGDFGQSGKLGGTPGWTAPLFSTERKPGKSNMYSMGLVFLYLLCETELFYVIRDNFVVDTTSAWMTSFRNMVEIKFVTKMMNLRNQSTVAECKQEWSRIMSSVQLITKQRLSFIQVPQTILKLQHDHRPTDATTRVISVLEDIHGKPAISITSGATLTSTRTHQQDNTELCWLYSICSSLEKSLMIKIGMNLRKKYFINKGLITSRHTKFTTESLNWFRFFTKKKALKLVRRGNFHQLLRKEIMFGLIPKTVSASVEQQHEVGHLMDVLQFGGFLTDVKGLWQLETIKEFSKLLNVPNGLPFTVKKENIDVFCRNNGRQRPIIILEGIEQTQQATSSFYHAVVINDTINYQTNGTINVRNSLAGNMIFGQKQPSVHEIECKITKKPNQWNLASDKCYYIEFY